MIIPKNKLLQVERLISKKKFDQALAQAEVLIKEHPDDPMAYSTLAICYVEMGHLQRALEVLRTAQSKFPKNHDILYYLAETLNQSAQFEEAEKMYREAIAITPLEFKEERSQCYNGLGVVLWEQHHRKEALDAWELAIKENPRNVAARKNLAECTNEYNEPAAPTSLHSDLYHFQKIQTERYFHLKGITAFNSVEDTQRVLNRIMAAWNLQIAPRGVEIDNLTPAEKTEVFRDVKIDFE